MTKLHKKTKESPDISLFRYLKRLTTVFQTKHGFQSSFTWDKKPSVSVTSSCISFNTSSFRFNLPGSAYNKIRVNALCG